MAQCPAPNSTARATLSLGLLLMAVALVGGCHRYPPPTPLDQLTPQQTRGNVIFQAHCAKCHNDRIDESLHGPSLVSIYQRPTLPSGTPANDDRVRNVILHGYILMPALGGSIQPDDLDDLLTYLHTL